MHFAKLFLISLLDQSKIDMLYASGNFEFYTGGNTSSARMLLAGTGNLFVGDDTDVYANIGRALRRRILRSDLSLE